MAHQALGLSLAEDDQLMEAIVYYRTENEKVADCYLLEASYLNWKDKGEDAVKAIDKGLTEISDSVKRVQLLVAKAGVLEHQRKYDQADILNITMTRASGRQQRTATRPLHVRLCATMPTIWQIMDNTAVQMTCSTRLGK